MDTVTCYIEYLNAKRGFSKDRMIFTGSNAYNEAVKWGKKNLENFHFDMVRYAISEEASELITKKIV